MEKLIKARKRKNLYVLVKEFDVCVCVFGLRHKRAKSGINFISLYFVVIKQILLSLRFIFLLCVLVINLIFTFVCPFGRPSLSEEKLREME